MMRWTAKMPKNFPSDAGEPYRLSYTTEADSHRETLLLGAEH
jgi:hypothetical protein